MSATPAQKDSASFKLSIAATTGYKATTTGTCTAEQYGAAMAALHGKPTAIEVELLEALKAICDEQDANEGYATPATYDAARAAIAKATGEAA